MFNINMSFSLSFLEDIQLEDMEDGEEQVHLHKQTKLQTFYSFACFDDVEEDVLSNDPGVTSFCE